MRGCVSIRGLKPSGIVQAIVFVVDKVDVAKY